MPNFVVNGTLTLGADPVSPSQVATKGYVDNKVTNIDASHVGGVAVLPGARMPAMSGDLVASQGSTTLTLINSGVVAGSYTKVRTDSNGRIVEGVSNVVGDYTQHVSFNNILPVSRPNSLVGYGITDGVRTDGTTMEGMVSLSGSSFSSTELVTKGFVDSSVSAALVGRTVSTGDIITRPSTATPIGYFRCNGGMVNKMAYPELYAVVGDGGVETLSDKGYGKPWSQQYDINLEQSTDITAGSWSSVSGFPVPIYHGQVVVTKNRIYHIGGIIASNGSSAVYTAAIGVDGSIGAWATTTPIPQLLYFAQAVVARGKVYLIGGHNQAGPVSTVYVSTINADGSLGAWTETSSLPTALYLSQAVVTKGKIYLLGGHNGGNAVNTIYKTAIDSDGLLGSWVADGTLPGAVDHSQAVVVGDRVYILGGHNGYIATRNVYMGVIGADGSIGNWSTAGNLPAIVFGAATIVTKGKIYMLGGNDGATALSTAYTATINADGSLGTWSSSACLPIPVYYHKLVVTHNKIYTIGGFYDGSGVTSDIYSAPILGGLNDYSEYYAVPGENILNTGKPWAQQYDINKDGSAGAAISGWASGTALPASLKGAQAVITENRAYLIGGTNGTTPSSAVYTAAIATDGTFGAWSMSAALPQAVYDAQAVILKDKIILIGGNNGTSQLSKVYTADIAVDGTISAWVAVGDLPETFSRGQAVATGTRLYIFGGMFSGARSNKSYYTEVSSTGMLSGWVAGGTLPVTLADAKILVVKKNVYLIGGTSATSVLKTHCRAVIQPDGSLGAWANLMTATTVNLYGTNTSAFPVNVGSAKLIGKGSDGGNATTVNLSGSGSGTVPIGTTAIAITGKGVDVDLLPGYTVSHGRPWEQQFDINTTDQSAGSFGGFVSAQGIPSIITGEAVVTKNRVYLFASSTSGAVHTATLNNDGSIGAWSASTPLPEVMQYPTAVAVKNKLYVFGGIPGNINHAYQATINTDGTLTGWVAYTDGPSSLKLTSAAIIKNKLYLFGGSNGSGIDNYVYHTTINADGTLGAWSGTQSLPVNVRSTRVIVTESYVYLLCGAYNATATNEVYVSNISPDGTLGAWSSYSQLPTVNAWSRVFVTKNRAYLIGGHSGSAELNTIYSANISAAGVLGTWTTFGSLPIGLSNFALISTAGKLHILGGNVNGSAVYTGYSATINGGSNDYSQYYDGTQIALNQPSTADFIAGAGAPWNHQPFNNSSTTTLGAWSNTAMSLPVDTLFAGSVVVTKNRVYLLGGHNGTGPRPNIASAAINVDGSIGAWSSTTTLPADLSYASVVVTKNKVYLIGGLTTSSVSSSVYKATVNADGTLSTFTADTSTLPVAIRMSQAVFTGTRVYLLGGRGSVYETAAIYSAPVDDNGTIGAWVTEPSSLAKAISESSLVVTKNRVYLLGGYDSSVGADAGVQSAPINSNGTLGAWSINGASLPVSLYGASAVSTKNRVYLIGGTLASGSTNTQTYTAAIASDGTIGTWSTTTASGTPVTNGCTFITSGRINTISGVIASGVYNTSIQSVSIDGGRNDYSIYYDGTVPFTPFYNTTITLNGVTYTFAAGSTAVPSTLFTHNATLPSSPAATYTYAIPAGGTLGLTYQAVTTSTNSLTGVGTINLPSSTTTVNMTAKGAAGTSTAIVVGAGKPWQQHAGFAASTSNANITGWTTNHMAAPNSFYNSCVAVTKDHVYLMGGTGDGSNGVSMIYKAPATGVTLDSTSQWTAAGNLPIAVMHAEVFTTFNRIYLVGGRTSGGVVNTVYTAPIDANGVIGSWVQAGSLPGNIERCKAVVIKNKVYLIGGWRSNGVFLNTVYTATVFQDGTLSGWSTASSLPSAFAPGGVAVTSTRVYVFGGTADGGETSGVFYANINSDGTLGGWMTDTNLPTGLVGGETYVTSSRVYYFSSYSGNGQYGLVFHAPIVNGVIGAWVQGNGRGGNDADTVHVFALQNKLYCISNGLGYTNSISYATIATGSDDYNLMTLSENTTGASSTITLAGTTYTFPGGNGGPAADTTQSVTLPGNSAQVLSYVMQSGVTAAVNYNYVSSTNGSPATVTINGTTYTFPGGTGGPAVETSFDVTFPTTGTAYSNNIPVYGYARLEYDTPTSGSALPAAVSDFQTYVTGSTAYVIGGTVSGAPVSTIYTSTIDYTGVLSPWTASASSLNASVAGSELLATKTKVYLLGGYNASGATPAVQLASFSGGRNDYASLYTQAVSTAYAADFKLPDFTSIESEAARYYIKN